MQSASAKVAPNIEATYGVTGDTAAGEISSAVESLKGVHVPINTQGSSSGHAVGDLGEQIVGRVLREKFPGRIYSPEDVLNAELRANVDVSATKREQLFGSTVSQVALTDRRNLARWSPETPFVKGQHDTADLIFFAPGHARVLDGQYALLDVKTTNLDKNSQPPNIISAKKLYRIAEEALATGSVPFDLTYVFVGHRGATSGTLSIANSRVVSMFKIAAPLYINWGAGAQIQFHASDVDQDFEATPLEWCRHFLTTFIDSEAADVGKRTAKHLRNKERVAQLLTQPQTLF